MFSALACSIYMLLFFYWNLCELYKNFTHRCVSFDIIFVMRNHFIDIFPQSFHFFFPFFFYRKPIHGWPYTFPRTHSVPRSLHRVHPDTINVSKEYYAKNKSISNENDFQITSWIPTKKEWKGKNNSTTHRERGGGL